MFWDKVIYDSHIHVEMEGTDIDSLISDMLKYLSFTGMSGSTILPIKNGRQAMGYDAVCLLAKILYPNKFDVYDGFWLNNPAYPFDEDTIVEQTKAMIETGFGGCKMLFYLSDSMTENDIESSCPRYIDDPRMDVAFDIMEKAQFPICLHMGLPADRIRPQGPRSSLMWETLRNMNLPKNDDNNRTIRRHMENRLRRNPNLRITFAHMYFMAGELDMLQKFMDEHPNCDIDICPANGVYWNLSKDVGKTREFFINNQDRILFGTDNIPQRLGGLDQIMNIRRFLETDHTFFAQLNNGIESAFWGHEISGISLSEEVLNKIYFGNWEKKFGFSHPMKAKDALRYCREEWKRVKRQGAGAITEDGLVCLEKVIDRLARL